ncbi:D-2-hydroxyacid dehydrogenase [Candidatus Gracilibacteria bacterium]|nr:D-2-hydroxyacid dehydrogenase [Candidatus Gracilibacteria bacterium]
MKNKILLITRGQKLFKEEVISLGLNNADIYAPEDEEGILEHIVDADIIFGNPLIVQEYINKAKNLKWMQSSFAGIDAMVQEGLQTDYTLTNVKDVYGAIMSEYVLGYILVKEKEILGNIENQKNKNWAPKAYPSLTNKTIGIMGTGSIGSHIAKMTQAFGMKTLGYGSSDVSKECFDVMYTQETIQEFLSQCDYVVSVLPNTDATKGIINKDVFSQMKPSGIFMSLGRGANLIEEDLIEAIKTKEIAGAVLDVFQIEPLPKDSELWSLENVFITPHISGYDEDNESILKIFSENYKRFISGQDLIHKIDFNKGY